MWALLLACAPPPEPSPYLLELPPHIAPPPMPADNPLTVEGVALGRRLFYDPAISLDGSLSCASCHQQALAFTDGRPLALDREGLPLKRNAMSLVNLAWETAFTWDGSQPSIEAQALAVLRNPRELARSPAEFDEQLRADPRYRVLFQAAFPKTGVSLENAAKALAQFLRTIVSFNARIDQMGLGTYETTDEESRGSDALTAPLPKDSPAARADLCNSCHDQRRGLRAGEDFPKAGLFSGEGLFDNGQPSSTSTRMRAPTIRNIAVTGPYLHDGRLGSLEALLRSYDTHLAASRDLPDAMRPEGRPARLGFTDEEIVDIVAVLNLFTDPDLLQDPRYGPPDDL